MTVDEIRKERQLKGIQLWIDAKCKGTLNYATGVGKTYTTILMIQRVEKKRNPLYLIVVTSVEIKKQWEKQISDLYKNIQARILIETVQTLINKDLKYQIDILVVDEAHEFATEERLKVLDGTLVEYKAILCLTASADDKRFKAIVPYAPVIDTITEGEARASGFIADFIEYNVTVPLTAKEKLAYDAYTDVISTELPKFNNNLSLAQFCLTGGTDTRTGLYYSAVNWAKGLAIKKGWADNLNLSFETHQQVNNLWHPNKIIGYAVRLMEAIRFRKNLLSNCTAKINTTVSLLKKFDKVKTIVFSESTGFADKVYRVYNSDKAVVYHSNLKTVIAPSLKTGKPIKKGKDRLKKEAVEAIKSGKARVIITSKALDRGFDVPDIRLGITASGTQNPTQYKQRGGRVKRKEVNVFDDCTVLLINLYVKNTQDEKWLKTRQQGINHKIIEVSEIGEILYTPPINEDLLEL